VLTIARTGKDKEWQAAPLSLIESRMSKDRRIQQDNYFA
jgi:hypothetical protein